MALGNAIGIPFFNTDNEVSTIYGLLNFDDIDDYVGLSSIPDVTGTKTISFSLYIHPDQYVALDIMVFSNGSSDWVRIYFDGTDGIRARTNYDGTNNSKRIDISSLKGQVLDFVITKTTSSIDTFTVNGSSAYTTDVLGNNTEPLQAFIGKATGNGYDYILIWDININDEHAWAGQPDGNQDSAWVDTIGSIDGTVNGTPTTYDLVY